MRERKEDIEILARHFMNKFSEEHGRNIKGKEETARALGIDLATLYRKFKRYGIEVE